MKRRVGGRDGRTENIIHMAILLLKNNPGKNFFKGCFCTQLLSINWLKLLEKEIISVEP